MNILENVIATWENKFTQGAFVICKQRKLFIDYSMHANEGFRYYSTSSGTGRSHQEQLRALPEIRCSSY